MELALFPIAALLLLLSGVSAPARSVARQVGTAALMRDFFGAEGFTASTAHAPATSFRILAHYLPQRAAARCIGDSCFTSPRQHARHAEALPYAFDRKHFRSRFGFAEGAYFALGPPLA